MSHGNEKYNRAGTFSTQLAITLSHCWSFSLCCFMMYLNISTSSISCSSSADHWSSEGERSVSALVVMRDWRAGEHNRNKRGTRFHSTIMVRLKLERYTSCDALGEFLPFYFWNTARTKGVCQRERGWSPCSHIGYWVLQQFYEINIYWQLISIYWPLTCRSVLLCWRCMY